MAVELCCRHSGFGWRLSSGALPPCTILEPQFQAEYQRPHCSETALDPECGKPKSVGTGQGWVPNCSVYKPTLTGCELQQAVIAVLCNCNPCPFRMVHCLPLVVAGPHTEMEKFTARQTIRVRGSFISRSQGLDPEVLGPIPNADDLPQGCGIT